MRARLVRLALVLGLITALVSVYVAPRHAAATAARSVTFVTDVGSLNDNGFNHLGYVGTTMGAANAHWKMHVIETTSPADYTRNLTIAAQQSVMVVAVGFSFGDALLAVSRKFPADKFVIIDYDYNGVKPAPKNVLGNDFMPNQSSYLAGIVAAGVSKTHVIGFVGGLNVLDHARDHRVWVQEVLDGVDADAVDVALVGRGQRTQARGARGVVDDVRACIDLLQGRHLAFALVGERAGVGLQNLDPGIVGPGAGLVAG